MRRILPAVLICFSMTFPALARSGGHGGGGASHGGGGHAGGSVSHGVSGGFRSGGGFSRRPGFRSGFGFQRFPRFYSNWGFGYYGGLGYYGYYDPSWYSSPDQYPDSGYNSGYGYQNDQAPPVIINQDFQSGPVPAPMLREYTPPVPAAPPVTIQRKYDEPLYLIAFNDGVIRAALAYWVDGASLHYVTLEHAQKQVALASIDRGLSERLNGERQVTFQLPR
jgi:hypothetical protein